MVKQGFPKVKGMGDCGISKSERRDSGVAKDERGDSGVTISDRN
jgi:hypothetical protein